MSVQPEPDLAELQAADRAAGAKSCSECGCTDRYACPGGCSWVALKPNMCSRCWARQLQERVGRLAEKAGAAGRRPWWGE